MSKSLIYIKPEHSEKIHHISYLEGDFNVKVFLTEEYQDYIESLSDDELRVEFHRFYAELMNVLKEKNDD